jgi:hypothetical protein
MKYIIKGSFHNELYSKNKLKKLIQRIVRQYIKNKRRKNDRLFFY